MPCARRWDPCIAHTGAEVDAFVKDYFASADRKVLFVAGAGFIRERPWSALAWHGRALR